MLDLNLSQLDSYTADIAKHAEALATAKRNLEYARLQAKQTRQMAAMAKRDPNVKALRNAYPDDTLDIMPAPGAIWVSINLRGITRSLYSDVPDKCGFTHYRTEANDARFSHHYYRNGLVQLVVTEHHV